jgi:hypothetical protein
MSGNEGRDMHPANLVYDTTWIAKLTRRHEYLRFSECRRHRMASKSSMTSSAKLSREEPNA